MKIIKVRILRMAKDHQGLIFYTFFNYFDKLLIFCIPIIILWKFQDQLLYNEIEYIYSIATIVIILLELGVRNFFIYEYKHSVEKKYLIKQVHNFFALQFVAYFLFGSFLTIALFILNKPYASIILFVTIRSLYTYWISFYSLYYRLLDTPSKIFFPSISVSLLTLLALFLYWLIFTRVTIFVLLLIQISFTTGAMIYFLRTCFSTKFKLFLNYVSRALKYAWPLILNLFIFMLINNFGRLYAQNVLSADEMTNISLIQRLTMIIQLGHASAAGYYIKQLFLDDSREKNEKIFYKYSLMLFGSALITVLTIPITNMFLPHVEIKMNLIAVLIIGYTIAWCYTAFFELYINKLNKNYYIPLFTGASLLLLLSFVFWGPYKPLINISLGMFIGMLLNCLLVLWAIDKHGEKNV